ncbi:MAG: fluoride efflux transporter CrcB [Actinobacteria bacterium]|nr:fluoride efflux transporter CrcB [Actinomycetota bacterium]MCB9411849.1 fluoride efflux transporter CrcB [Actinomycetota bacterium]
MLMFAAMLGAALGAPTRWWLDAFIGARHNRAFPWGTWTINMLGSLALGWLLGAHSAGWLGSAWLTLLGTGFCGGFTTYSTFSFETVRLWEQGARRTAVLYLVVSLGSGLALAAIGWQLALLLLAG